MNEWLQWAAIIALVLFVCFARGSAVNESRRQLKEYDQRLGDAIGQSSRKARG